MVTVVSRSGGSNANKSLFLITDDKEGRKLILQLHHRASVVLQRLLCR